MTDIASARPAPRFATRTVTTAALLAALLAASSLFALRIGPVPLTLQVLVVVVAALLLTPAQAGLAVGVYLLEGAIGLPVFAGMLGGVGVLVGPTGGYLWGFLAGAVLGALVRERLVAAHNPEPMADAIAASVVILCVYVLGAAQLSAVAHLGLLDTLAAGVLPFVGPDLVKAVAAVALAGVVRRALPRA